MADEGEKQGGSPSSGAFLSDETVNLLRNAAKRKGWKDHTPDQIANGFAAEFILNDAFAKREKPLDELRAARLPDGSQKVGASDKTVPGGSLIELLESEKRREAEEE